MAPALHDTTLSFAPNIGAFSTNGGAAPRRLRIAQLAPLYESVPPKLYGGTERVVAILSEELARRGHDVTLFASGDSTAKVPLKPIGKASLRLAGKDHLGAALHLPMLSAVFDNAEDFDIIHSHLDFWGFPFARLSPTPVVTTLHGRLDGAEFRDIYESYTDSAVVSISDSQRTPLPRMNWMGTVYHGLPANVLKLRDEPGSYLAFLGRISPEKRPDLAIKIARRAGIPLKIAAKLDRTGVEYFEEVVRPLLDGPGVEFVGEINDSRKQEFLGNAVALVFPIDWPEPFGLVTIEAMACGTPVLARPCGSIPEILEHGVSGIIAETVDDLADAARRARNMSRSACRAAFDRRFTAAIMASNYEQLYLRLIESRSAASKRRLLQVSGNSRQESSESGDSTQV